MVPTCMSDALRSALAVTLRRTRKKIGMKYRDVGISSLARIESGQHGVNTTMLFRLAATYGVLPSTILQEAEEIASTQGKVQTCPWCGKP